MAVKLKKYDCKCGAPYDAHDWEGTENGPGACPLRLTTYSPDIPDKNTIAPPPAARPLISKADDLSAICARCGKPFGEHSASISTGNDSARIAKPYEAGCPDYSGRTFMARRSSLLERANVMTLEEFKATPKKRGKTNNLANNLTREIVTSLELAGCLAVRVNNGAIFDPVKKIHRRTNTRRGISDILGALAPTGRLLACEIKIGKDDLTPEQSDFLNDVRKAGGVAITASSYVDFFINLSKQLNDLEKCQLLQKLRP